MAFVETYALQIAKARRDNNNDAVALLLSLRGPHVRQRLLGGLHAGSLDEARIGGIVGGHFSEMVCLHLVAAINLAQGKLLECLTAQRKLVALIVGHISRIGEIDVHVTLLRKSLRDLRLLSALLDRRTGGEQTYTNEFCNTVRTDCYTAINREQPLVAQSALFLASNLFNAGLRLGNMFVFTNASRMPMVPERSATADIVEYSFYMGRFQLLQGSEFYDKAYTHLHRALSLCPADAHHNRKRIVLYYVVTGMQRHKIPRSVVLRGYGFDELALVADAVRMGNAHALNSALSAHAVFFAQSGIMLLIGELRTLAYRNLCKMLFLLHNSMHSEAAKKPLLPIEHLATALRLMGVSRCRYYYYYYYYYCCCCCCALSLV